MASPSDALGAVWRGEAMRHATSASIRFIPRDAAIQSALSWMPGQVAQRRLQ